MDHQAEPATWKARYRTTFGYTLSTTLENRKRLDHRRQGIIARSARKTPFERFPRIRVRPHPRQHLRRYLRPKTKGGQVHRNLESRRKTLTAEADMACFGPITSLDRYKT